MPLGERIRKEPNPLEMICYAQLMSSVMFLCTFVYLTDLIFGMHTNKNQN